MKVHNKKLAALVKIAEADGSQYREVLVDSTRSFATDGRMMILIDHLAPTEELKAGVSYALPAATIEDGKGRVATAKAADAGYFEVDAKALTPSRESIARLIAMMPLRENDGVERDPVAVLRFDLARLIALGKVLFAGEGDKIKVIEVEYFGGDQPLRITAGRAEAAAKAVAYLAPCRAPKKK